MAFTTRKAEPLSDEQIAAEEQFLKGLPHMNWGALFMPAIWGPAHGFWVAILFYPLWLVADNVFYGTMVEPTPFSITIAVLVFALMVGLSIAFAIVSQPFAAHRAEALGVDRAIYLRRERWWAVASILIALVMVILATYYNLAIRPTL